MDPQNASLPWFERVSDWLNPILIKETRQSLKSRQFVATFLLMLVASWAISIFGVLLTDPRRLDYGASGRDFFYAYYFVLAVAIYVIVPYGAFRSLLSERDLHTYEVLSISALKPRQIVWGKLLSAIVQMFIFYSAIAPFMAFTILLKGIDGITIAFLLGTSLLWAVGLALLALTISTLANQRHWQALLTLQVLGGLIVALFIASLMVGGLLAESSLPFDRPEFWWIAVIVLTYFAAGFVLLMQIAISRLTFESDNRSTGIRFSTAILFWMSVGWIVVLALYAVSPSTGLKKDGVVSAFAIVMGLHWGAAGLFAVTEPDMLSRRVRRDMGRFGRLQWLFAPLLPGGGRGLVFVVLHLIALWLFVVGLLAIEAGMLSELTFGARVQYFGSMVLNNGAKPNRIAAMASGLCLYMAVYLGFAAATARWARAVSSEFRPAHARVLVLLLAGTGVVLPHLIDLVYKRSFLSVDLLDVTDPFSTLTNLASGVSESNRLLGILAAGAAIGLLINLRAMITGVLDAALPRQLTTDN